MTTKTKIQNLSWFNSVIIFDPLELFVFKIFLLKQYLKAEKNLFGRERHGNYYNFWNLI